VEGVLVFSFRSFGVELWERGGRCRRFGVSLLRTGGLDSIPTATPPRFLCRGGPGTRCFWIVPGVIVFESRCCEVVRLAAFPEFCVLVGWSRQIKMQTGRESKLTAWVMLMDT